MNAINILEYRLKEIKMNNNRFTIIDQEELLDIKKALLVLKKSVELAVVKGDIKCPYLHSKFEEEYKCPSDSNCTLCKILDIYREANNMIEKEN